MVIMIEYEILICVGILIFSLAFVLFLKYGAGGILWNGAEEEKLLLDKQTRN